MPGLITHLKTAYYVLDNKIASVSQPEQFYLGSISPDSVNVNGRAEKNIRWAAHLRDRDLNLWLNNVKTFWQTESKTSADTSFLLGYIVHIVTDIAWDMYFEKELFSRFIPAGIIPQNCKTERWNELYGYERLQTRLPWYKNEVLPLLNKAKPMVVGTLNLQQMQEHLKSLILGQLPVGHLPLYIDDDLMHRLYKRSAEMVAIIINFNLSDINCPIL